MSFFFHLLNSGGSEALPDPIQIAGDKVEFWFDNSDASTITLINTNEVDTQTDKTGNFTRIPDTDSNGNRPTYDSARKEIFYDGTVDGLVLQGALSAAAKAGGEIFVVARRRNDYTGVPNFFGAYDAVNADRYALLRDQANHATLANRSMGLAFKNGATTNTVYGDVLSLSDKVNIFDFRISPNVSYTFDWDDRGGIGEHLSAGVDDGKWIDDLTAFTKVSFGMWQTGASKLFSSYYELEILYCNEVLTSNERDSIYAYFNNKHNAYSEDTKNLGFVIWGQSNAVGQGTHLSQAPRLQGISIVTNLRVWTATNTFSQATLANMGGNDFGVDWGLMFALGEYKRDAQIYMLKVAVSGAPLASEAARDDFNISNGGELYDDLETRSLELQAALDVLGTNTIFTLLLQGERDAREVGGGEPDAYENNLNDILNSLTAAGFNADFHIINKLHDDLVNSTADPGDPITEENLQTVQAAQESVVAARPNAILLDLNNFSLGADFTHYETHELVKIAEYVLTYILQENEIIP